MVFLGNRKSNLINKNNSSEELKEEVVPTICQFFYRRYIDFRSCDTPLIICSTNDSAVRRGEEEDHTNANNKPISPFNILSYHVASVTNGEDDDDDDDSLLLGVWNCQLLSLENNNNKALQMLLDQIIFKTKGSNSSIFITLDLNEPYMIAPIVHSVVQALLGSSCCFCHNNYNNNTTSLESLASFQFGDAPHTTTATATTTTTTNEAAKNHGAIATDNTSNNNDKITLILACIMPTNEPSSYKDKQVQALLTYHLHRYAFLTKSTLIFVRRPSSSGSSSSIGIDISKLIQILCHYNSNIASSSEEISSVVGDEQERVVVDATNDETGTYEITTQQKIPSAIELFMFTPKDHDGTMIETTLRRNASCEGAWDVEKDSILVALPPPTTSQQQQQQRNISTNNNEYNDDIWLGKLAGTMRAMSSGSTIDNTTSGTNVISSSPFPSAAATTSSAAVGPMDQSKGKPAMATGEKKKISPNTDPKSFFDSLLNKSYKK